MPPNGRGLTSRKRDAMRVSTSSRLMREGHSILRPEYEHKGARLGAATTPEAVSMKRHAESRASTLGGIWRRLSKWKVTSPVTTWGGNTQSRGAACPNAQPKPAAAALYLCTFVCLTA